MSEGYIPVKVEIGEETTSVTVINLNGEEEILTSSRIPHKDLYSALDSLRAVFCRHMEIPKELEGRIRIRGIRQKETKDADGFIISASISCPATSSKMDVRTPMLESKGSIYWSMMDEDGNPFHLPEKNLGKLTLAEKAACDLALLEAGLFAKEGKTRKIPDLFSDLDESREIKEVE